MMIKSLLLAVDASAAAVEGAALAAQFCQGMSASVVLLHVIDPIFAMAERSEVIDQSLLAPLQRRGQRLLNDLAGQLPHQERVHKMILVGDPAEVIVAAAREANVDLLLMGTNGRSRLAHFPLGSVLDQVIRRSPCPVLVVPQHLPSETKVRSA